MEAFEGDIRRHRDIIDDIMSESASEAIKFLHVDCAPLKQASSNFKILKLCAC